ncbi:DUF4435 domain-containing protein [Enterobacterales bacterium AW_CKDN230030176-1A_HGKHYDSX7]
MSSAVIIPPDLQLKAGELLQAAIMGDMPLVIVEGYDDVRLYEDFAKQSDLNCDVIASENILTCKEGCEGVISNIDALESAAGTVDISKHVVGVIDRDARYFRNEIPQSNALFTLDLYSIESHFVGEETVRRVLSSVLNASDDLIEKLDTRKIYQEIIDKLMGVYEVCLEALKKACVRGYPAEIGYSDKIRSVFKSGAYPRIIGKKEDLHQFADSLDIKHTWQHLTVICKGKWLLELFCDHLHDYISSLPELCKSHSVHQCQFCTGGNMKKCLYRWRENYNSNHLSAMARGYSDLPDFAYIRGRLKALG